MADESRIAEEIHLTRSAYAVQIARPAEPARSSSNKTAGLVTGSHTDLPPPRGWASRALTCPPSPLFISSAVITANW